MSVCTIRLTEHYLCHRESSLLRGPRAHSAMSEGTTWTQEMVWCIANDLDFQAAKVPLPERFPFLDHSPLFDYTDILPRIPDLQLPTFVLDSVQHIADLPSPRFIKTHLPWSLLPSQIRTGDRRPKVRAPTSSWPNKS
uniref:Sulfotransferase domain-containing protein n=1 Tax=Timema cristinae TaxID=61476 RepID=A0A7R9DR43_TIMCR|nr:unnamed protein product [Timema cristinae]